MKRKDATKGILRAHYDVDLILFHNPSLSAAPSLLTNIAMANRKQRARRFI